MIEIIDIFTLNIIAFCLFMHWKSEIEEQKIFDSYNLLLLTTVIIRISFLETLSIWSHLGGFALAFGLMWFLVEYMVAEIGGGAIKLMIVSGLLLGIMNTVVLFVLSAILYIGFLCIVYRKYDDKPASNIVNKYPSGYSILIILPFLIYGSL